MLRDFFTNETDSPVDSQIRAVMGAMDEVGVKSDEYPSLMAKLEQLYGIKAKSRREPVSRDTLVLALTNLAGILLIVAYEQKHVMTSKGLSQLIHRRGQ